MVTYGAGAILHICLTILYYKVKIQSLHFKHNIISLGNNSFLFQVGLKVYIAADLSPVDSQWTAWESSTSCSQPCEGGTQQMIREDPIIK